MEKLNNKSPSPSSKNRNRFYSHEVDDEHFKALGKLRRMEQHNNEGQGKRADSQKSSSSHKVAKEPNDLLEGISDMFVHSDLSLNFGKEG
jgi:hypothetical protein